MQFNFFILGAILATSSLVVGQGNAAAGATNMQPAGYSDGSSGDASSYSSESNGGGGSAGVSGGGGSATGDGSSGIIFGLVGEIKIIADDVQKKGEKIAFEAGLAAASS